MTPVVDRLMSCVIETPGPMDTPCWISTYAPNSKGYVYVRNRAIHLATYEHFVGPIPDGLQLDHLCRVRACCNPAHLEPVTQRENYLRGEHQGAVVIRTGRCLSGDHSMDDAIVNPDGTRRCRHCASSHQKARRARPFVKAEARRREAKRERDAARAERLAKARKRNQT